jgi:hypothetical protein
MGAGWQHGPMGFNPHRPYKANRFDKVMVAAALVVCLALVVWAFVA